MDIKTTLETANKLLSVLTDTCKFLVLAALTSFAVAAFASPGWARQKLADLGLSVKEVNAFGVKLVANDAFDMAKDLAEAKVRLDELKVQAGKGAVDAADIGRVAQKLDAVSGALGKQSESIRTTQQQVGMAAPTLPATGWVYVGRQPESGAWQPGWSIDAARSAVEAGTVTRLALRADTVLLSNGNECVRQSLADIQPPSSEELQAPQLLLNGSAKAALEVLETARCPSVGKGEWVYARVRVRPEDVKFVRYADLLKR